MSREGLAYPPPAGDGDAMSAMNWLSDAERQQLHDEAVTAIGRQ